MTLSMYSASVPVLVRMLTHLDAILDKAAKHAQAHKFDGEIFVSARLFPDMLPLVRQVQIATDMAKGCAARLAGQEPFKFEDNEVSMTELRARISKTVDLLNACTPSMVDGSDLRPIVLTVGGRTLRFSGHDYLLNFVLPNFYFHITTAYAILRHWGVDLGKFDFVGRPPEVEASE